MKLTTTLGLDIGANSIGWALVREESGTPAAIQGMGVRVFEEGVNIDAKSGKSESRNLSRRAARLRRRQVARHAQRKKNALRILQAAGLLPPGKPAHTDAAWKEILNTDPYEIRARALTEKLAPQELGRAFFHLAERRGYKSNRKKPETKDEHGAVKEGIRKLSAELAASGAETLGAYFHKLNPHEIRIRTHYTRRDWYESEFALIWERQKAHHPQTLTPAMREELEHALFHQRPLLIRGGMIGYCELEPRKRRAPLALLSTQEFRLLQELNNLRIEDGTATGRTLTAEQREAILTLQNENGKVTFTAIRKTPALKKMKFNLMRGDRKDISGNRTAAQIREAIGDVAWRALDAAARDRLVNDLISIQGDGALSRRLTEHWKFDEAAVKLLSELVLEDGYAALSSSAIRKLLPHLREGKNYREAIDAVPWETTPYEQQDFLPPVEDLRNPIVQRALAEVRRVVNAIIGHYGRPDRIRIELARELKLNNKDRAEYITRMREREKERETARAELRQHGLTQPKRRDIEKWLLLKECNSKCPYTGKQISFQSLFETNEFEVEHILPFSRSFDDSFANKTLCHVHANRVQKRNATPFETYGETSDWPLLLDRVRHFTGPFAEEKYRRFTLEDLANDADFLDKFTERQLNDTKYAAVKAAKYLRILYPEADRSSAVCATSGRVTAYLRNAWNLNPILSDGPRKSRDDHRHHAVDALCVALTESGIIRRLSTEASREAERGNRVSSFRNIAPPWPGFTDDATAAVKQIVVSHRVSRKVQGQLHEETHYGLISDPYATDRKKAVVAVKRIKLEELTTPNVADIVDPTVQRAVEKALAGGEPKKVFKNQQNLPALVTKSGARIPIKKVRVRYGTKQLIEFSPARRVTSGNNHHLEVFKTTNKKGVECWTGRVVSMLDALLRKRNGQPIVPQHDEQGNPLLFSLVRGDTVEITWRGRRGLARVMGLSHNDFTLRWNTDARKKSDLGADLIRVQSFSALQLAETSKRSVDPIGRVSWTRD